MIKFDYTRIETGFMIKFGTDGWRAILDEEFNENNVKKASLAMGKYVYDNFGPEKLILIGYDPRSKSDFYADMCAKLLASKGFNVELSDRIVPTPILAYNALIKNACAIMFTASHNPPEYLGMKFIPDYAGPATSGITDEITLNLDKDFANFSEPKTPVDVEFSSEYYKHIETIIDFDKIKKLKSKIIFDGLYSASIGYFDEILRRNKVDFKSLHMVHNVNFGGLMPDPKPKYLGELTEMIKSQDCKTIGLANDGDADRFGVIDENGEYIPADVIIAILLKYLTKKGYKGCLVKTVGSSILLDIIAKKLGVDIIETAVGFKHVGEAMRKNQVIIGGEESGGLSISGHIPEKDGLIANLLILEAVSDYGTGLADLVKEIYDFAGCRFFADRIDIKKSDSEEIEEILNYFREINSVGGDKITDKNLKDGVKIMLGDKAKILVRPSGTEPLLRIYFETENNDKLQKLENSVIKILNEKFT